MPKAPRFSEEDLVKMKRVKREVAVSRTAVLSDGLAESHATAARSPSSLSPMEKALLPAGRVRGLKRQQTAAESGDRDVSPVRPSPTTQVFFVPGPLPGMNDYISTGSRFIYNNHKKKWHAVIAQAIRDWNIKPVQAASFRFVWSEKSKRRDPDNFTSIGKKFILDALVQAGVLPNDGWDEVLSWSDQWDISHDLPGVTVFMDVVV